MSLLCLQRLYERHLYSPVEPDSKNPPSHYTEPMCLLLLLLALVLVLVLGVGEEGEAVGEEEE